MCSSSTRTCAVRRSPTGSGFKGAAGLTECLVGRAEFDDVVQHLGDGPSVLASGAMPPNPGELLASKEFAALLEQVAEEYDAVFIDTPPLLPVADAVVVSRQVAGLILVVDASKARRPQLTRAVEAVHQGGGRVVGLVLNRSRTAQEESYVYGATRSRRRRWGRPERTSRTHARATTSQTG
ncbi:Capsular exopolysaccharide biosynthesis protein OS=Cellulomonas persica OX=76861 GN=CPE01_18330 PE=4 SV=1 [Cellulomonas persica]